MKWFFGPKEGAGSDKFRYRPNHPYAEEHRLIDAWLNAPSTGLPLATSDKRYGPEAQSMIDSPPATQGRLVIALLERVRLARASRISLAGSGWYPVGDLMDTMAGRLLQGKAEFTPDGVRDLVEAWASLAWSHGVGHQKLTRIVEAAASKYGLTPPIEAAARILLNKVEGGFRGDPNAVERRTALRLRSLLNPTARARRELPEPWQQPFADANEALSRLLDHAEAAKSTTPTTKWRNASEPLISVFGAEEFLRLFEESIEIVRGMDRTVDPLQADMLRGLAWFAGTVKTPRAASLLGRLLLASGHKIVNIGARSQKGFSGAVGALEQMGTFEALAELSNAKNRIKTPSLAEMIVKSLERAAERQGLPMAVLEELVVPTFGLELPGVRTEMLGDVEARLEIVGSTDVELRWFRAGKELKAAPAEIKVAFADDLKDLKAAAKDAEQALSAQRARIEGLMLSGRAISYPAWRERYLDHPLLANMVRRLVWRFASPAGEVLGIAPEGEPVDIEGSAIAGLGEETAVRLWHPIDTGASAIEAWREFLVQREIRQPFKQAHREIYILTDAERQTNTYSNRFAGHVLKQHQMAALAKQRGWRYTLQGYFDSQSTPTMRLPDWGLQAEYYVEIPPMGRVDDPNLMAASGIALYVVTDQVRFQGEGRGPLPLEQIPPVVFSEVMRDVDLFMGVSSVGNDPAWVDQGERVGYGLYWHDYAFGDLSASAETRRAVLQRLLPRLKIADVASLKGKFLVVQGKIRSYKIHLGSANILMEPNDQYLCIVPGRTPEPSAGKVFLPFEGDAVLAIILSKAFLLAEDDKISDPSITRQLRL